MCHIALFTGNGIGDACENDCDGDGVPDSEDTAPCNRFLTRDSLDQFMVVKLSNPAATQADWVVRKSGTYVLQKKSSDPELLLGMQALYSLPLCMVSSLTSATLSYLLSQGPIVTHHMNTMVQWK